jgi:hypothetical protein
MKHTVKHVSACVPHALGKRNMQSYTVGTEKTRYT